MRRKLARIQSFKLSSVYMHLDRINRAVAVYQELGRWQQKIFLQCYQRFNTDVQPLMTLASLEQEIENYGT